MLIAVEKAWHDVVFWVVTAVESWFKSTFLPQKNPVSPRFSLLSPYSKAFLISKTHRLHDKLVPTLLMNLSQESLVKDKSEVSFKLLILAILTVF